MPLTIDDGSIYVHSHIYNGLTSISSINTENISFSGSYDEHIFEHITLAELKAIIPKLMIAHTAVFTSPSPSEDPTTVIITTDLFYKPLPTASYQKLPVSPYTTSAHILPVPITITIDDVKVQTKEYDGTDTAVLAFSPHMTLNNVLNDDNVIPIVRSCKFVTSDIAENKEIVINIELTGSHACNYSVPPTINIQTNAAITPVRITTRFTPISLPPAVRSSRMTPPVRNNDRSNTAVTNDRLANAYAASRTIPQPIARPMDASTRTSLLRGATAVQR